MKILQLNTSLRGSDSVSTKFANAVTEKLIKLNQAQVKVRDLAKSPVSQLDSNTLTALFSGNLEHPIVAEHTDLINEIKSIDTLVMGVPMYNFTIPTTLKNYFDAIARAHETFKYTESGPVGLLNINKAYVVLSRGGMYHGKDSYQEDYLTAMLKFVGVKEVEFIYVEGVNYGAEFAQKAEEHALEQISFIN